LLVIKAIIDKDLKGYKAEEISQVFKFHGDTFLEQERGELHFKFRKPLYFSIRKRCRDYVHCGTIIAHSCCSTKASDQCDFQMPFFDSSDPEEGECGSHLNIKNLDRISRMNVQVQHTLNESYYLGLDKGQLKRRNEKQILNNEKV
jgi:hypothetical protein